MRNLALVLTCLAFTSHARKVHVRQDQSQANSLTALELLLQTLNPVAAWRAPGAELGHHAGVSFTRSRSPPALLKSSLPIKHRKPQPGAASALTRWLPSARRATAVSLAIALVAARTGAVPAAWAAAAAEAETHLHLGQKVAQFFRGFGLSDELVITLISAMPAVELRGGIPVGIWMGMPALKVLALCVLGNMIPIYPLLFALKFGPVQKLLKPVLDRAQRKAEAAFADPKSRAVLLAAFVGIPLPGTGAWTGAMGAFLLGMPVATAMTAIFAGVIASGLIMSAISQGGIFGTCTGAVLLGSMLTQVKFGGKNETSTMEEPGK